MYDDSCVCDQQDLGSCEKAITMLLDNQGIQLLQTQPHNYTHVTV